MLTKCVVIAVVLWTGTLAASLAAPTISVNHSARSNEAGHHWVIEVRPDTTLHGEGPDVVDIDLGLELNSNIGQIAFSKPGVGISGFSVFGDETADGDGKFQGVQLGSDPTDALVALQFEVSRTTFPRYLVIVVVGNEPLSMSNLTSTFSWGGAYDAAAQLVDSTPDATQLGTHSLVRQLVPEATSVSIAAAGSATYTATLGDADLELGVGLSDFAFVLDQWGIGTTWQLGNFAGSGTTGLDDFNIVLDNWGAPSGQVVFGPGPGNLTASGVSIPEPSTSLTACVIAIVLVCVNWFGRLRTQSSESTSLATFG